MSKKIQGSKLSDLEIAYKRTFGSTEGRMVLEDLKKLYRFNQTVYHSKQPNEDLHFQLGQQDVVNNIDFILAKEAK